MTIFEIVSDALMKAQAERKLDNLHEYCIYWNGGDEYAAVNVPASSRYASRIREDAKKYPSEYRVFSDKDGVLVAGVPTKAVKISYRESRELSEEELEVLRERIKLAQNAKNNKNNSK